MAAAGIMAWGAAAQDTIKIAYIDPLSGGGASIGEHGLKHFNYIADMVNAKGGVLGRKLEILPYDNKTNPQESLLQAQKAIDAGARILTQGNGSSVAAALSDFVAKHNERNPGKEVIYLNYAAVDPVLTNDKCNFWHFRWDANSDIKMEALTNFMKDRPAIKKIYLINQDYSFGQAVRSQAVTMLKAKRPDIQIVGDELHPLLRITDFAPYVAKIKASGADSVITGNWGQDMALLLKAAADAGLQVDWYTYYAGGAGGPTAIKQTGLSHRVFAIVEGHANVPHEAAQKTEAEFRARTGLGVWYPRVFNQMAMLVAAIEKAKSADPVKIGKALEGMEHATFTGGKGFMRADDHQFFQDMYIASFGPLEGGAKFDEEKTGWGWKTVGKIDTANTILPTTCKMQRPS
ncbi:MAG: branched-chain amino acid ABC transporter substrate-binding protein [Alphaproteobacteria bacterium]|nr:branched-chain amino acid ABC transporter substrate-binding protein [Alphaproteobacteria bacterium]